MSDNPSGWGRLDKQSLFAAILFVGSLVALGTWETWQGRVHAQDGSVTAATAGPAPCGYRDDRVGDICVFLGGLGLIIFAGGAIYSGDWLCAFFASVAFIGLIVFGVWRNRCYAPLNSDMGPITSPWRVHAQDASGATAGPAWVPPVWSNALISQSRDMVYQNSEGKVVVTIHGDGAVEYGQGFNAKSAAKEFWSYLAKEGIAGQCLPMTKAVYQNATVTANPTPAQRRRSAMPPNGAQR